MNCKTVREKIDQLVFEKNDDLMKDVEKHIQECSECRIYMQESLADAQRIEKIQKATPVPSDALDLTNSIMNSVENLEQENFSTSSTKSTQLSLLPLLVRVLAAASVCLLLVLGVEQFAIVKKVRTLEAFNHKVSEAKQPNLLTNQAAAFSFFNASDVNSGLIWLMLERKNARLFQMALNQQSEYITEMTKTQQQNAFLNSKIMELIGK